MRIFITTLITLFDTSGTANNIYIRTSSKLKSRPLLSARQACKQVVIQASYPYILVSLVGLVFPSDKLSDKSSDKTSGQQGGRAFHCQVVENLDTHRHRRQAAVAPTIMPTCVWLFRRMSQRRNELGTLRNDAGCHGQ